MQDAAQSAESLRDTGRALDAPEGQPAMQQLGLGSQRSMKGWLPSRPSGKPCHRPAHGTAYEMIMRDVLPPGLSWQVSCFPATVQLSYLCPHYNDSGVQYLQVSQTWQPALPKGLCQVRLPHALKEPSICCHCRLYQLDLLYSLQREKHVPPLQQYMLSISSADAFYGPHLRGCCRTPDNCRVSAKTLSRMRFARPSWAKG